MSHFLSGSHFTNDKEVILAAAQHTARGALRGASVILQRDAAFVKTVVAMDGMALKYASEYLRKYPTVQSAATRQNPSATKYFLG